ncbi:hypothetical protein BJ875DRAFT_495955 [Amylocarpus encephaloides]|uniref:Uncharacterized protein n=1 Tax=Amylocarpus encephaloides TaxID=45428 RepID=A0A9P8C5J4_9HELO|nr:hypothetical protein BJ875DRAFT_495955 [Amylocarpus encephaloides]
MAGVSNVFSADAIASGHSGQPSVASAASGITLDKFEVFEKLPNELQLNIIKFGTNPDCRVVLLQKEEGKGGWVVKCIERGPSFPLSLLKAAREEILRGFKTLDPTAPGAESVLVNYKADIITFALDWGCPIHYFVPGIAAEQRQLIRTVGVYHKSRTSQQENLNELANDLHHLGEVEQLIISSWLTSDTNKIPQSKDPRNTLLNYRSLVNGTEDVVMTGLTFLLALLARLERDNPGWKAPKVYHAQFRWNQKTGHLEISEIEEAVDMTEDEDEDADERCFDDPCGVCTYCEEHYGP